MNEKMRSCVMGLIPGLFSSPLPMAQKEPVAYLYNGVRLPALPEWDRETYPYAVIHVSGNGTAILTTLRENPVYYETYVNSEGDSWSNYVVYELPFFRFTYTDGAWVEQGASTSMVLTRNHIWCSEDILNGSGNVYLAASEPIPVYE